MELIRSFADRQYADALESWRWLGLDRKAPIGCSLFGDVLFEAGDGCWYLDLATGQLERVWPSRAAANAELATQDGRARWLRRDLAETATRRGLTLADDQVFDFVTPPVLGGAVDASNLNPADFVVTVNIAGQIHDQVRKLPAGTRIAGVDIRG